MHLSDILLFIPNKLIRIYTDYKDTQKWREFYAKLDRNAEGRFDMKQHRKDVYNQQKKIHKKNVDLKGDRKT